MAVTQLSQRSLGAINNPNATYTLASQTTLQKLFATTTNGALTVEAGTTYFFECEFNLSAMSATSGAFSFGFLGTATFTSLKYTSIAAKSAIGTPSTTQIVTATVATATALVTASVTTTGHAFIRGVIRTNAAGTIIPAVALGIASAGIVGVDSWFTLIKAGTNTSTLFGAWT